MTDESTTLKFHFSMILFNQLLILPLTDGIWNYTAMSKFPLQYLVISISISSQIIVQLPFSFYFSFSAEKR